MSHIAQLANQAVKRGQQDCLAGTFDLQCMTGVVNVFAGARKMDKLGHAPQFRPGIKLGFDPVFDRLDVVVSGFLNFLDGHGIGLGEVLDQA